MMKRKLSQNGLKLIKKYEGCRLNAYKDIGGVWTIGYGHTKGVKKGDTISQSQADAFLLEDCTTFVNHVNRYTNRYQLNQNQFDALVSFAYNIGSINQLTKNGTMSINEISKRIPLFCNCNGKKVTGLVNRRNSEKILFDTPIKQLSIKEIASQVIAGKWGNGEERKRKLTEQGYDYESVRKCVNNMLRNK